jgi:hypothetical protein
MQKEKEPFRVLSWGGGRQSTTALMLAAVGKLPRFDAVIWADTQGEPASVYRNIEEYVEIVARSANPMPIYRVTKGSLEDAEVRVRRSKKSGRLYMGCKIPAFIQQDNGRAGLMGRRCTMDFKITPIQQKVRELLGIKRAGKDTPKVEMSIGISLDEFMRAKRSVVPYIENVFPLIDMRWTVERCVSWLVEEGYPMPPKSSCRFCPFHSDAEWKRLKDEEPEDFDLAVQFEKRLQEAARQQEVLTGKPFLHSSMTPLDQVKFNAAPGHQQVDMFAGLCDGLCGV